MSRQDVLKQVLKTYKFDRYLSPEAKKDLFKARTDILVSILKTRGEYTLFIGLVIFLFFRINRFGISLTIAKSSTVVMTALISAVVVTAASVSTGVYIGVKHLLKENPPLVEPEPVQPQKEDHTQAGPGKTVRPEPVPPTVLADKKFKNAIIIKSFERENSDNMLTDRAMGIIKKELARLRGSKNVLFQTDSAPARGVLLYVSVEKTGEVYFLSTKAVNKEIGKIVFMPQPRELKTVEGIDKACREAAGEISDRIQ
ncbi:MAG: hypothetical protein GY754_33075 [bacterium]|nr:hypothetical protein [bacterium]